MALTPSERALSLNQLQTPANQVARSAARGGSLVPQLPSQQFSIQAGLEQLTSAEQDALRKVVARLRARRQQPRVPGSAAVSSIAGAVGGTPTFGGKTPIPSALRLFGAF